VANILRTLGDSPRMARAAPPRSMRDMRIPELPDKENAVAGQPSPPVNIITVLLVDDHELVRDGLRMLLQSAEDIQVVGEAENGHQAVQEAIRLQPDVILLDLAMPVLNGIEAARQIAHEVPSARVLILSSYNDGHRLRQAVEAGASGYLMKETGSDNLLAAVRQARNGAAFFNPLFLGELSRVWAEAPKEHHPAPTQRAKLTWRESEVLQLIAEGYASKQIGDVLSLAGKTIEKHRQTLMAKLGLHKIADLTRYAVAAGIVESGRLPGERLPPLPATPEKPPQRIPRPRPIRTPVSGFVRSYRS
jgi:DNA-binding NarL/FixJ family response regulator